MKAKQTKVFFTTNDAGFKCVLWSFNFVINCKKYHKVNRKTKK